MSVRGASGERIDDFEALGRIAPREVLGVQPLHARVEARRDDQRVPERPLLVDVQRTGSNEYLWAGKHERHRVQQEVEMPPGVRRGETLFRQFPRGRYELTRRLSEDHAVIGIQRPLGDLPFSRIRLVAGIDQNVGIERFCSSSRVGSLPFR
jgi:hypothetical protein